MASHPAIVMDDTEASKLVFEHPSDEQASFANPPKSAVGCLEVLEKARSKTLVVPGDTRALRLAALQRLVLPRPLMKMVENGHSLYPYLRLFLASADEPRKAYGLAEKQLAKAIGTAADLGTHHKDILEYFLDSNRRLLHERDTGSVGHFPATVFDILQYAAETEAEATVRKRRNPPGPRPRRERSNADPYKWTVGDVNKWLDRLYTTATSRKATLPSAEGAAGADVEAKPMKSGRHARFTAGPAMSEIIALFRELWVHVTAHGMKWVVRMIDRTGDMGIGMKPKAILELYSKSAAEGLVSRNLTTLLHDPALRPISEGSSATVLHRLEVMSSLRPMACGRMTGSKGLGDDWFANGFFQETKLDGERMMLHKKGNEVKFFSRNRHDNVDVATDLRDAVLESVKAEEVILDGEALVWSDRAKGYLPFGSVRHAATAKAVRTDVIGVTRLCYFAFDIVYLKGEKWKGRYNGDITQTPLRQRKEVLKEVLPRPLEHRLEILPHTEKSAMTKEEASKWIDEELEAAMQRSEEGLILKLPNSVYEPGVKGKKWVKVKPEFWENIEQADTVDVAIIGGYLGTGKKGGGTAAALDSASGVYAMSSFMVAMPNRPSGKDENGVPLQWTPLTSVGGGLTIAHLFKLREVLSPHMVPLAPKGQRKHRSMLPDWMRKHCDSYSAHNWKQGQGLPDFVLTHPKHAIILAVQSSEVIFSTMWPMRITYSYNGFPPAPHCVSLRFARVKLIRVDDAWRNVKDLDECDDESVLQRFMDQHKGRMFQPKPEGEEEMGGVRTKARKKKAGEVPAPRGRTLAGGDFEGPNIGLLVATASIFANASVAVLQGSYKGEKEVVAGAREERQEFFGRDAVAARARLLGAREVFFYPPRGNKGTSGQWYTIADGPTVASAYCKLGLDVYKPGWLSAAAALARIPPPRYEHFVFLSPSTEALIAREEDTYGGVHVAKLRNVGEGGKEDLAAELASVHAGERAPVAQVAAPPAPPKRGAAAKAAPSLPPSRCILAPPATAGPLPVPWTEISGWSNAERALLRSPLTIFRDGAPRGSALTDAIAAVTGIEEDEYIGGGGAPEVEEVPAAVEEARASEDDSGSDGGGKGKDKKKRKRGTRVQKGSKKATAVAPAPPAPPAVSPSALAAMEVLVGSAPPLTLAYVDGQSDSAVDAALAGMKIQQRGGRLSPILDADVNVVIVVPSASAASIEALRQRLTALQKEQEEEEGPVPPAKRTKGGALPPPQGWSAPPIVTTAWLDECCESGRIVAVHKHLVS
jgi:ATP-dependent DNA ligase I